jgi:hypothetical protein
MSETTSLADALAKVQGQLTAVGKDKTAQVKSEKANYSYTYADLASVQEAVFPLMAAEGLAWITRPTYDEQGRYVLAYTLAHGPSGEREDGFYPLPDPTRGTPQQIGSAITYGRRYCLSAVVGVATEDDDGRAASDGAAPKASARRQPERKAERGPADQDAWAGTTVRQPPDPEAPSRITEAVAGCSDLKTLRGIRADVVAQAKTGALPEMDAADLLSLIDEAGAELRAKYEAEQAKAPS